jgi:NitT/TauT family transport system ATP-binding protein
MKEANYVFIEVKNLCQIYDSANGKVQALEDLSLSIVKGEFVSIIGPSGCGKSTLIRIIGDLLEPTSGTITVAGMTPKEARLKRMFSYVFQNPVLLNWRSVIDNVALPLEIKTDNAPLNNVRDPHELLRLVGLEEFALMYPQELSGGMQHRAALARALTFEPQVLFMDEPFAAADELTRNALNLELLRIWQKVGVTVLYVTHSLSEALFLSNRVFVLSARPAKVKDVLSVPFPYPREEDLKETAQFQEMVKWLRRRLESVN